MNETQQKVLIHDPERCTGCLFCMVSCSYKHHGYVDLNKANIKITFNPKLLKFEATYCHHCDEPICMTACPVDAISKDEITGIVKTNPAKCIGCHLCNIMCPLSVSWFDTEARISQKCDLCDGDPECVKFCPTYALRFVPREEVTDKLIKTYQVIR